jgi:hypothetical protein
MKVQVFHYQILQEAPLSDLVNFKEHRRLRVFYHKGAKCVTCDKLGTRLILGKDGGGTTHWDLYTEDLYPLTVDHIVPKSLGGSSEIDNLQPMCSGCNTIKGNGCEQQKHIKPPLVKVSNSGLSESDLIGRRVWKKRSNNPIGTVSSITINPHTKLSSALVDGNQHSFYDLHTLYLEQ